MAKSQGRKPVPFGTLNIGEVFFPSLESESVGTVIPPVLNTRLDEKSLIALRNIDPVNYPSLNPRDYPLNTIVVCLGDSRENGHYMRFWPNDTVYISQ